MIDVKKLLYKYKQLIEAKRNAEISIKNLNERHRTSKPDENWYIRGTGSIRIPTEESVIFEEQTVAKIEYLQKIVSDLTTLLEAIERAVNTLNKEQQELIKLRYFEDNTVPYVTTRLTLSDYKYHHLHRVALDSLAICLSSVYVDAENIDKLIFAPMKARYESTFSRSEAMRRTKEKSKKNQSFPAS